MIRRLPSTGRCDALGRLLVELPNVAFAGISKVQLVVRAAGQTSPPGGMTKGKSSTKKSTVREEPSTKISENSLTVPNVSAGATMTPKGTRYNIPSSSISSSSPPMVKGEAILMDSTNALTSDVQKLQIGSNNVRLELPVLAVEYKRASDSAMKGTNQLRMYLTASVKFLQAIGIKNVPVYGAQTSGPLVVLPVAILKDDGVRRMFMTSSVCADGINMFDSLCTCLSGSWKG